MKFHLPLVLTSLIVSVPAFADPTGARGETSALDKLSFGFDGYIRVLGRATENDELAFIGRNDGFRLADVRLGIQIGYGEDLHAYVSIDAAGQRSESPNDPNAEFSVELKDAYIGYDLADALKFSLGRFKAPYDVGELESTADRVFIDAPVESSGVGATEGLAIDGLSQGRQLALMIYSEKIGLTDDGFDLGYALAVTNGFGEDLAFADNDTPAVFGRLSLLWGSYFKLNLGGFFDRQTRGVLPDRFEEDLIGAEASIIADFSGLSEWAQIRIEVQGLFQHRQFETAGLPSQIAYGGHAQISYQILWFELGYRYAMLEPNNDFEPDTVSEHTAAFSFLPEGLPLKLSVNGTFADEQLEVDNNRLDFLAQFTF